MVHTIKLYALYIIVATFTIKAHSLDTHGACIHTIVCKFAKDPYSLANTQREVKAVFYSHCAALLF